MYATIDEYIAAFGHREAIELSNSDDSTAEYVDRSAIQMRLDDASALIDSYLQAAGYALPLPSTPVRLRSCACEIARYYLDRLRMREDVRDRYEQEIAYLKEVAAGKVSLGLPLLQPATPPDLVHWYSRSRVFTDEALRGY